MKKTIEEIKKLMDSVKGNTNISELIDANIRICGLLIYAAESESELLKNKLVAYNERKIKQARLCLESNEGITKAEKKSIIDTQKEMQVELESEVTYQAARSFRMQVGEFSQALVQKISFLKQEQATTKYQNG